MSPDVLKPKKNQTWVGFNSELALAIRPPADLYSSSSDIIR